MVFEMESLLSLFLGFYHETYNKQNLESKLAKLSTGRSFRTEEKNSSENTVPKPLGPNEICIEGKVYSLDGFEHPGGDAIRLFGGNDVTVQYRMIHPHHTEKQLEKLQRLGKVADSTIE